MTDAWATLSSLGSPVTQAAKEATRQALLQNPVFTYPMFAPVEQVSVVSVTGASADVAETTIKLPFATPPNTGAVVYFVSVTSTATGVGSTLFLRHKKGGVNVGGVNSCVLNQPVYNQVVVAPNSGSVTYIATKGAATAYNYTIAVVGFFRSY